MGSHFIENLLYWTTDLFWNPVSATTDLLTFSGKIRYRQLLTYWPFLRKSGNHDGKAYWPTDLFSGKSGNHDGKAYWPTDLFGGKSGKHIYRETHWMQWPMYKSDSYRDFLIDFFSVLECLFWCPVWLLHPYYTTPHSQHPPATPTDQFQTGIRKETMGDGLGTDFGMHVNQPHQRGVGVPQCQCRF